MTHQAPRRGGSAPAGRRWLPGPVPVIRPATSLHGVSVLKHENVYLLTDERGDVYPDDRGLGLYDLDTRILSRATLALDGHRPTLLRSMAPANNEAVIELAETEPAPDLGGMFGDTGTRWTLSIRRRRWLGGGLAEQIAIANHDLAARSLVLDLEVDVDAADMFEVRGLRRRERGRFLDTAATDRSLVFSYIGLDSQVRHSHLVFTPADVDVGGTPGAGKSRAGKNGPGRPGDAAVDGGDPGGVRIRWRIDLGPGQQTQVEWRLWSDLRRREQDETVEATRREAGRHEAGRTKPRQAPVESAAQAEAASRGWLGRGARITSDSEPFARTIERSLDDLRLLVNRDPHTGFRYVAAGVPWFTTLFGRDAIVTALEALPFLPDLAVDTLRCLAAWQATDTDPSRDMTPGKIPHELRSGELARAGEIPQRPYYGTVDATPLWLILLSETVRWTGDLALLRELWPNATAALEWIDRFGDIDGDGLVEYSGPGPGGLVHQGWKDSDDAIRHRDGSLARPPIALVEVQGYVFDAKLRMAELGRLVGEEGLSQRLEGEAEELRARFDAAFWMPEAAYFAVALDRDKRQVETITSNPLHALWSGIVVDERIDPLLARLRTPELDSGWGIRTYAADQPGYNPVSYHCGSIWPHDNAIAAAGLRRMGRHAEASRLATEVLEAARHSPGFRLPELYCGFDRTTLVEPVPYPVACSPQAWAAAAPLSLLRTLAGLRADAVEGVLVIDRPTLPSWLDAIRIEELRVGSATADLELRRERGRVRALVHRRSGELHIDVRDVADGLAGR